ncbi:MAG: hypothetical protein ABIJ18_00815 [archaeon]
MSRRKTPLGGMSPSRYDTLVGDRIIQLSNKDLIVKHNVFIFSEGVYPTEVSIDYRSRTYIFDIIASDQINNVMAREFDIIFVPSVEELVLDEKGEIEQVDSIIDRNLITRLKRYAEMRNVDFKEAVLTPEGLERVCFKYLQEKLD